MGIGLLIEYLNNSKALLRAQALLKDFCGLDLFLLDVEGKVIPLSAKSSNFTPSIETNDFLKSPKNRIEGHLSDIQLQEVTDSKSAIDFVAKDGFIKIVVPIVYNEQVVGSLLTTETQVFKLNRSQVNSLKSFLNETIKQVVDHDFKFLRDFKGSDMSHQKKTLYRITEFINQNYHQSELSLNEVSKKNNISYYYLSHLFKKELKTTFSNYLNNIRLDVASRLLKDRSLTVSQVSFSCGFEDPSYFSKVFKKHHGASPVAYREKMPSKRKIG